MEHGFDLDHAVVGVAAAPVATLLVTQVEARPVTEGQLYFSILIHASDRDSRSPKLNTRSPATESLPLARGVPMLTRR
jgi:hypothetical protein